MFNPADIIFAPLWDFILGKIYEVLFEVVTQIFTWIISSTTGFWTNPIVSGAVSTSRWACTILILATMVVVFFDVLEDYSAGKPVFIGAVVGNLAKALAFGVVAPILPEYAIKMTDTAIASINLSSGISNVRHSITVNITSYTQGQMLLLLLTMIIILIACIAFLVIVLKRFGVMLVQVFSCVLYIPSILRGDTTAMSAWLRQTIAITLTFFVQYIFFYLGLRFWVTNDMLLAFGVWLAMGSVPKTLDKYGYSTGAGGSLSSAASSITQGVSMLAK